MGSFSKLADALGNASVSRLKEPSFRVDYDGPADCLYLTCIATEKVVIVEKFSSFEPHIGAPLGQHYSN